MRFSTIIAFMLPLLTALAIPRNLAKLEAITGIKLPIDDATESLKEGVDLGLRFTKAKDALDILQSNEFKSSVVDIGEQLDRGLDPRKTYVGTPRVVTIVDTPFVFAASPLSQKNSTRSRNYSSTSISPS